MAAFFQFLCAFFVTAVCTNPVTANTVVPSTTGRATKTTDPSTTGRPANTMDPSTTGRPANTMDPSTTGRPANTMDPSTTGRPANTMDPSTTGRPANTIDPSTTGRPANTMDPSTTGRPANARPSKLCRDRQGYLPDVIFRVHACSKCLDYILGDQPGQFRVNVSFGFAVLQSAVSGGMVQAEPGNQSAMSLVCRTLSGRDCRDWKLCCQAAKDCCQKQLETDGGGEGGGCPMTWDGFSCVDRTAPGQSAVFQCPSYVRRFFNADLNGQATRKCWPNSTWFTNSLGLEWSDYSSCLHTNDQNTILTLKLAFKGSSLVLLIPSIVIFLMFRPFRSQLRIKLHINLFVALALHAVFSILWETIVIHTLLTDSQPLVFLQTHNVSCKFLNIMSRCVQTTTFFWMFCEGFYLTHLVLQSFHQLSSMIGFYLLGWGAPVLLCLIYVIVRFTGAYYDEGCWITDAGNLEWLIDGPTLACIGVNVLFLLAIMRVMVRQLRSHNEQQSVVRRAARALVILVPLFGLQQFFILYRPKPSDRGAFVYEVISAIIISSQGAAVALIFCFFNGEVQGQLKEMMRRLRYKLQSPRQSVSMSSFTQSRASRPSLASVNTAVNVVLAPFHFATNSTTTTTASGGGDGGGDGSWRIRLSRVADSGDGDDVSNYGRVTDEGGGGGGRDGSEESCDSDGFSRGTRAGHTDHRATDSHTASVQLEGAGGTVGGPLPFISNTVSEKLQTDTRNTTGAGNSHEGVISATGLCSSVLSRCHSCPTQTTAAVASSRTNTTETPACKYDDVFLTSDGGVFNTTIRVPAARLPGDELASVSSEEGRSSGKDTHNSDSDSSHLVHSSASRSRSLVYERPKHALPHRHVEQSLSADVIHTHRKRHRGDSTSGDDVMFSSRDEACLMENDSTESFVTLLPADTGSEGTSVAETDDSGISLDPTVQGGTNRMDRLGRHSSAAVYFVNSAFEED